MIRRSTVVVLFVLLFISLSFSQAKKKSSKSSSSKQQASAQTSAAASDQKLFGALLRFLQEFPGAPALIMSATIPPTRLDQLQKVIGGRTGEISFFVARAIAEIVFGAA